jgi:hypothetical protein
MAPEVSFFFSLFQLLYWNLIQFIFLLFIQNHPQNHHQWTPSSSLIRFLQNKSFWSSITDRQKISCYEFLCSAFDSARYDENLARALEIPTCRVIPYFKHYLDKMRFALSSSTDFSFTSGSIEEICAKVSDFYIICNSF